MVLLGFSRKTRPAGQWALGTSQFGAYPIYSPTEWGCRGTQVASGNQDKTLTNLLVILLVLVFVVPAAVFALVALTGLWGDGSFGMMDWWGGGMGLMMLVPGGVVLLIIIVLILAVLDRPGQTTPTYPAQYYASYQPPPAEDPLAILDRRLAAGEISVEEYNRIRNTFAKH